MLINRKPKGNKEFSSQFCVQPIYTDTVPGTAVYRTHIVPTWYHMGTLNFFLIGLKSLIPSRLSGVHPIILLPCVIF